MPITRLRVIYLGPIYISFIYIITWNYSQLKVLNLELTKGNV